MPLLQPGDLAPDFELTAHTGASIKLGDHAGQHVILWFYPKADTPG
jgi:thioredoxin-dependent peroxiredoxin